MSRSGTGHQARHKPEDAIRFGPFELDPARFELRREGRLVPVEPRTFDLLALLAHNIGHTVTRDEIFAEVWQDRVVSDAALSSQVRAARSALGDDGSAQRLIATVHGRGFRLCADAPGTGATAAAAGDHAQAGARPGGLPTLLVLPCTSLETDGRGCLLAQGMTEDIMTAISRNRWLRVVPRSTAFTLGKSLTPPAETARQVGADYLLASTVRRDGNRVRISVQAIAARDMRCLWSERFDREMTDIFDLQEEISHLVSARLATELGLAEKARAARQSRRNLGAWELYQLGLVEFYRFTADSNRSCQRLMRQAIRQDPAFGSPYARLAHAMILEMVHFDGARDPARMDEALDLALRGVECDDQDAAMLFSLGRVRLARCEYALAIDALEEALRLNPCHALSHCGLGDSLAYEGRLKEAIGSFQAAIDLSPHDPFRWAFMSYRALAHLFGREFGHAARWARRATQVPNAHVSAIANLASALGHTGERQPAEEAVATLLRAHPDYTLDLARDRLFYVKDPAQLDIYLDGLRRAGLGS